VKSSLRRRRPSSFWYRYGTTRRTTETADLKGFRTARVRVTVKPKRSVDRACERFFACVRLRSANRARKDTTGMCCLRVERIPLEFLFGEFETEANVPEPFANRSRPLPPLPSARQLRSETSKGQVGYGVCDYSVLRKKQ